MHVYTRTYMSCDTHSYRCTATHAHTSLLPHADTDALHIYTAAHTRIKALLHGCAQMHCFFTLKET
jgi:hypothetical protein